MEIKVKYLGGEKFEVTSQIQKLTIEQPLEIFLFSLGSCAGVYAKRYCQNAGIDSSNLEIIVSASLTTDRPLRFQEIEVKISPGVDIGERKTALLNFVKNCPVHNTLKANPSVEFII